MPRAPSGRGQHARRRGQTVVEFGLVVMLFVLMISAVFDFGVLLNTRLSISALSGVLARAAAENETAPELQALAGQQGQIIGVTTPPVVTYTVNGSTVTPGTLVSGTTIIVNVQAQDEVFTPMMRVIFGCTDGSQPHCYVPVNAQTAMRVEPTPALTPTPTSS